MTTTRPSEADVRSEPAGRRLDELVARYVCGWTAIGQWTYDEPPTDSDWVGVPPNGLKDYFAGKRKASFEGLPRYSTDWSAAGPLLESCPWPISASTTRWGDDVVIRLSEHDDDSVIVDFNCKKPHDLCRAIAVARVLAALANTKEGS